MSPRAVNLKKARIDDEAVLYLRKNGALLKEGKSFGLIDLFSGAGGLTLGFSEFYGHAFRPVWANDINEFSVRTYNLNFGNHCEAGDIVEILSRPDFEIPKADVVIGGPPCQGFSLLNKKRKNDHRNQLWRPFLEVARKSGAKIFLIENVPQLLGSPEYREIIETARGMGYKTAGEKLCAADYGVPQTRWRAFIIGCRFAEPSIFFPPKKTHLKPDIFETNNPLISNGTVVSKPKKWKTVREVISDLPSPAGTEMGSEPPLDLHFKRNPTALSIKRYKAIPGEGMNRFDLQRRAPELTPACWIKKKSGGTDLFGRLWWDRPALTIRTEFFKPEKGRYLHPQEHRPITHREAARIQSFPDSFLFCGNKTEIARQIGNAVPPELAARIADCVYALLVNFEQ